MQVIVSTIVFNPISTTRTVQYLTIWGIMPFSVTLSELHCHLSIFMSEIKYFTFPVSQ